MPRKKKTKIDSYFHKVPAVDSFPVTETEITASPVDVPDSIDNKPSISDENVLPGNIDKKPSVTSDLKNNSDVENLESILDKYDVGFYY